MRCSQPLSSVDFCTWVGANRWATLHLTHAEPIINLAAVADKPLANGCLGLVELARTRCSFVRMQAVAVNRDWGLSRNWRGVHRIGLLFVGWHRVATTSVLARVRIHNVCCGSVGLPRQAHFRFARFCSAMRLTWPHQDAPSNQPPPRFTVGWFGRIWMDCCSRPGAFGGGC